jgi:hypothetical protein
MVRGFRELLTKLTNASQSSGGTPNEGVIKMEEKNKQRWQEINRHNIQQFYSLHSRCSEYEC